MTRRPRGALLAFVIRALAAGAVLGVARARAARAPIVIEVPKGDWHGLALSESGEWLAVATRFASIQLWKVEPGALPRTITTDSPPTFALAFEPGSGDLVVYGTQHEGVVRRFSCGPEGRAGVASVFSGSISTHLSPDGSLAIDIFAKGSPELCLWDTRTGKVAREVPAEEGDGWDEVGFSASGALFFRERDASAADETLREAGRVRVWATRDAKLLVDGPGGPGERGMMVRAVLDPGDRYLLETPEGFEVREVSSGRTLRAFAAKKSSSWLLPFAVSRDGELLALAEGPVEVRAIRTGELVASFAGPEGLGKCEGLAFDRAADRLAGVWNGRAVVWRVPR